MRFAECGEFGIISHAPQKKQKKNSNNNVFYCWSIITYSVRAARATIKQLLLYLYVYFY